MRTIIDNKIAFAAYVKCGKCGRLGAYDLTTEFLCGYCMPKAQPGSQQRDGSAPCMVVTQDLVKEIIARARNSRWGLGDAKCSTSLDQYAGNDEHDLALLLVTGWEAKYDLVSLFAAAIAVVNEKAQNGGAEAQPPKTERL